MGFWLFAVGYAIYFLVTTIPPYYTQSVTYTADTLDIPKLFYTIFELTVDGLTLLGFWTIALLLFVRRSDDWFAIFMSIFLMAFGIRVTEIGLQIAALSGHKTMGGLILATADSAIVLFTLIFPSGKFNPPWVKYAVPVLLISMVVFYAIPGTPFFWMDLPTWAVMIFPLFWYLFSIVFFIYRYQKQADIAQKQQMRWVFLGLMGPFSWYVIFNIIPLLFPIVTQAGMTNTIFHIVTRISGIFLFLVFPLFLALSIARFRLFDIDLLINRSLVYFTLTVGLGLTFAAMMGLVTLAFRNINQGDQSMMALTVSAVAAGAMFQPARKRLQRLVDRVFYHIQIEYDKTPAPVFRREEPSLESSTLSSYRGLKLIGRGGMAEVYKAESPTSGKPVAIKVLPPNLAEEEQFRRRFMREAEAISGLDHPNIVRVINFGHENKTYYIVMEYLTGPDLNNLLKQQKKLPLQDALRILRDTAAALDYAHLRGLVHRDIKPSNVMLDSNSTPPRAVLTDFGIAKIADAHTKITATGVLGTFDYIAPEQIQSSGELDGRADIYALGVMTYQMLTGHLPFERPNTGALLLAHLTNPAPDAREQAPELPRHVSYAIQRAMAKKPKDRYATAGEFVAALESA